MISSDITFGEVLTSPKRNLLNMEHIFSGLPLAWSGPHVTRGATTRTPGPTVTGAEVVSGGAWGTDGLFVANELSTKKSVFSIHEHGYTFFCPYCK